MNIAEKLAEEFSLRIEQAEKTISLIDEGNTIPFIARYRKEATGGLSDVVLRDMETRLGYLRGLEERKEEVIRLIDEQGKLTEELKADIEAAEVLQRVEDIYKPFRHKKATRASKARAKGLEPLADTVWEQRIKQGSIEDISSQYVNEEAGVMSWEEALAGACDILAERISDDPEITAMVREYTLNHGIIVSEAVGEDEKSVYEMYHEYREAVSKIPNHRILAVNRGENEKILRVTLDVDTETVTGRIARRVRSGNGSIFDDIISDVVKDAYKRLMAPSIEREIRNMLTERAEEEAIRVFAKNTENLLMTPPVAGARVIAIDPGYRTGCKVAVLNETGKLLAYTTIYPTKPREDIRGTEATLKKIIDKFNSNVIVIGNGTASRETEEAVADFIRKNNLDVKYTIVNEAGASVYSASRLATEEYPDLDVTTRGAMSLGRRLQDPLAELVKISPEHIGVGQYQHDLNQKSLQKALSDVVENCVNRVGVDLNTASASLLSYVSGINMSIAKNIVAYREENGSFTNRKQLLKVSKLGPKAFTQCAGFCRISGGDEILDSTSVHPESYEACEKLLERLGIDGIGRGEDIEGRIKEIYPKNSYTRLADEIGIGVPTLKDIVEEIKKPGRDPRDEAPEIVFRNDVRSFDDLAVDMELTGTVRNVVDFGAFVDIGVKNDGLIHISQLSDKYINHPMDVVAVGDTVRVKIISIDKEKQRVGLTMKGVD